ncbi:nucleotidyltransferase family protein [Sulfuricurvum sp.]|uniref:nucleotidyltransferase domain-containing protein n=1 Tax=Sulfuricurvum sp. TaxID=2025608 RepID=UPI002601C0A9|nr:nucleotidyltransferase family protein [Sulfuricurvum sp.]MDD2781645.1 nucleotidyltransferase family protein [Sulfuricurvum sp.]
MTNKSSPSYDLIIECCRSESDTFKLEDLSSQIIDWNSFLNSAYVHGVYPLIVKSLKTITTVPDQIISVMKTTNIDIARHNMTMTSELLRVMKILEENGIESLAIKGPVLSQMIYKDVVTRQYVDIDLLVEEKNLYPTVQLLMTLGYSYEHLADFLHNRALLKYEKNVTLYHIRNKVKLEIHWKLFMGRLFKQVNSNHFNTPKSSIMLQGYLIRTLDQNQTLFYLILHGSKHLWERVEWLSDIDRLVRTEIYEWDKIEQQAIVTKTLTLLYLGIALVSKIFQTPFPQNILDKATKYPSIHAAVEDLTHRIFMDRIHTVDQYMENYLYLGLDGSQPIISKMLSRLYKPGHEDIYRVNLPSGLHWVYYLILLKRVIFVQCTKILQRIKGKK